MLDATDDRRPHGPVHPTPTARSAQRPLDHVDVRLHSGGWLGEWQRRNASSTIPHVLDRVQKGEARANLARLVDETGRDRHGMAFTDTDVYKTLEAVAWAAGVHPIEADVITGCERLIELLEKVQEDDGYVNSYVQGTADVARWSDPQWAHELYTAGHLFQAAVAAARTGVFENLMVVAERFAELLVTTLGGTDDPYVDGHPEVETALVELYRQTGQGSYLRLAEQQIARRGHGWLGADRFGSAYFQDHIPVRDADFATGHAVRQLYLLCGAVDVAVETGDDELLAAAERVHGDLFATKTYVSGAHGSRHRDEAIGDAFELPPDRAYAETCAAIASFQLNWRLLLATGEHRYADEMERVLYNAIAVSTDLAGTAFFYSNPLQLRTGHDGSHEDAPSQRLSWFECACCPPNIGRLVASIHDYLLTTRGNRLSIQHYGAADVRAVLDDGVVTARMVTGYPHDGRVRVDVEADFAVELALRLPSWCSDARLSVDGRAREVSADEGYVVLPLAPGRSAVELELAMPVRRVAAHPRVDAVRGSVALMRGPVLYALEQADLPAGVLLEEVRLAGSVEATASHEQQLSPVAIAMEIQVESDTGALYRAPESGVGRAARGRTTVRALPYHRWANRGDGAMRVWIPEAEADA